MHTILLCKAFTYNMGGIEGKQVVGCCGHMVAVVLMDC